MKLVSSYIFLPLTNVFQRTTPKLRHSHKFSAYITKLSISKQQDILHPKKYKPVCFTAYNDQSEND